MVRFVIGRGYQAEFGVFVGGTWEDPHPDRFRIDSEQIRTCPKFQGHVAFYSAYRTASKSGVFDDNDSVSRKLLVFLDKLKLTNFGLFVVRYQMSSNFSTSDLIKASLHAAAAVIEQRLPPSSLDLSKLPPEPRPMFRSPLADIFGSDKNSDFSRWSENERLLVDLPEDWIARLRSFACPQNSVVKILQVVVYVVARFFPSSWSEIREFLRKSSDTLQLQLMTSKRISDHHPDTVRAREIMQGLNIHVVRRTSEVAGILLQWVRNRLTGELPAETLFPFPSMRHAIFSIEGVQTVATDIRLRPVANALSQKNLNFKRVLVQPSREEHASPKHSEIAELPPVQEPPTAKERRPAGERRLSVQEEELVHRLRERRSLFDSNVPVELVSTSEILLSESHRQERDLQRLVLASHANGM